MKTYLLIFISTICNSFCYAENNVVDLSGQWHVTIDSLNFTASLPGSLTQNKIGYPVKDSVTNMLSEQVQFTGKAIYEREVIVPENWNGKAVELYMERTKVSQVFINDLPAGFQNSVSAPHVYSVGKLLKPGKNRLKMTVDNTKKLLPLGGSHAYSEHTQTNWNGILGDFYLKCLPDVEIQEIQAYPKTNGDCRIMIDLDVSEAKTANIRATMLDMKGKTVSKVSKKIQLQKGSVQKELQLNIPNPQLWDEYHPYLYTLKVEVEGDIHQIKIGIRDFHTQGKQLINNNRIVFLRGKHEGGVFPLTGYPSMKKDDWKRNMSIAKSYGINHYRFHSWCPPKAAFDAADELGIFIQPELPLWGRYAASDTIQFNYMKAEGERIMKEYGNHPSFVMFALGNELEGDTSLMVKIVNHLRAIDDRHLYALGSNNFYWDTQTHPAEDFFVAMRNGKPASDWSTDIRGSFSFADSDEGGIINCQKPGTKRDFSQAIQTLNKPVIGHETGQYQIYPNFKEIEKYTGVMQARNFSVFKNRLEKAGMSGLSNDFVKASGALAALCYKEEIELALRTADFSGFQLLDLQDYPGQGTALVGILDAFMDSKGVIEQQKWLEFCNDVVPLARFQKYCWKNDETFTADIEIANYGSVSLTGKDVQCTLTDSSGKVIASQVVSKQEIAQGKLNRITTIQVPLQSIVKPEKLTLTVLLPQTSYRNSWDVWVYPVQKPIQIKEGKVGNVLVTRDKKIYEKACSEGNANLLYIPDHKEIDSLSVGGLFTTDFWNFMIFKGIAEKMKKTPSPGTFGILADSGHPVFTSFPTNFYTNWQWWNIVKHARPMILDYMPENCVPVVRIIDNFDRNHKLGLICEISVGKGRILVCMSDLFACKEEPEVKQLFQSMVEYLETINN